MVVGYALLSQKLTITGIANIKLILKVYKFKNCKKGTR